MYASRSSGADPRATCAPRAARTGCFQTLKILGIRRRSPGPLRAPAPPPWATIRARTRPPHRPPPQFSLRQNRLGPTSSRQNPKKPEETPELPDAVHSFPTGPPSRPAQPAGVPAGSTAAGFCLRLAGARTVAAVSRRWNSTRRGAVERVVDGTGNRRWAVRPVCSVCGGGRPCSALRGSRRCWPPGGRAGRTSGLPSALRPCNRAGALASAAWRLSGLAAAGAVAAMHRSAGWPFLPGATPRPPPVSRSSPTARRSPAQADPRPGAARRPAPRSPSTLTGRSPSQHHPAWSWRPGKMRASIDRRGRRRSAAAGAASGGGRSPDPSWRSISVRRPTATAAGDRAPAPSRRRGGSPSSPCR